MNSTRKRDASKTPHWWSRFDDLTKPVDAKTARALAQRWSELPEPVRTPGQVLGRFGVGCEGTHGVFPKCDFACTPCYHSSDANKVRVDGAHTLAQIESQMAYLEETRGAHAHAQLIGGEVSLLSGEDHAAALEIMRRHGREPMSFSHGDFEYEYLEKVALDPQGKRRFKKLSFAVHIDSTMKGRRGMRGAPDEKSLDPYRRSVAAMFQRLRREHGVKFYLAHNVTVTPANVDQIPELIRDAHQLGYGMFSFQPAAFVGDDRRWREDYASLEPDRVWSKIEEGAGTRLPYEVLQVGDTRCNRTAWGFYVGERWISFFNDEDPKDLVARDALLEHLGGVHFNAPAHLLALRLARLALRRPSLLPTTIQWLGRTVGRSGGIVRLVRERPVPVTFVMHRFMHAADVKPAWDLLERGVMSEDPRILETQERLLACSYAMAHPETGQLVPACVQHGVLDPDDNAALAALLPIPRRRALNAEIGH